MPRKSKPTKVCPLVGSGILAPWMILKTILCLVDWTSRVYIYIPGTQMTLVLIGISALFWGVDLQEQRSFGFQVYIYIWFRVACQRPPPPMVWSPSSNTTNSSTTSTATTTTITTT